MKSPIWTTVLSLALGVTTIGAAEHPREHPSGTHEHAQPAKQEHPKKHEHPKKQADETKKFQDSLEKTVQDYVKTEAQKTGGVYTVQDDVLGKAWKLELTRVHKNKVCMLGESTAGKTCFACADFKEVGGKNKLDLDFYATKSANGSISIDKVLVHKVNGKPRFTYDDQNNMVPAK